MALDFVSFAAWRRAALAIYHLSVKAVSRSAGRSATAAAAYRTATRINCAREGRVHDYARRSGVAHAEIIVPDAATWAQDRSALWNAAEAAEKRSNATVAREYELALPEELSAQGRVALARAFGRELTERYGVGVDIAIHAPSRKGDQRNWHAHVLTTTRVVAAEGLGKKTRVLDDQKTGPAQVSALREVWADLTNRFLEQEQQTARVDHRSLEAQRVEQLERAAAFTQAGAARAAQEAELSATALDRTPQMHVGVAATGMERKAEAAAIEAGEAYEPVTDLGAMRAAAQAQKAERVRLVDQAREALARLHQLWDRVEALWGRAEAAWSRTVERFGPAAVASAFAAARAYPAERRAEAARGTAQDGPTLGGFMPPRKAGVDRESIPAATLTPKSPEAARRRAAALSEDSPPAGPAREAPPQAPSPAAPVPDPLAEALALARTILTPTSASPSHKPAPERTGAQASRRPEASAPAPTASSGPATLDAARRDFVGRRELARAREMFAADQTARRQALEEARLAAEAQERARREAQERADAEAAAERARQKQEHDAEQARRRAQRDRGPDFGM